MDAYQSYIHKSKYARFLEKENRREEWHETVDRYINFVSEHLSEKYHYNDAQTIEHLRNGILNMEVMPSMRAMMAAGKAAKRDNVTMYNCSALPVDDMRSFDEAMYILMCGTGVGFSVERQYVNQLPEVPDDLVSTDEVIKVGDSKEGWARAYRDLIFKLYSGKIPTWDMSAVRPAGSPLKTFGGRASGPEPLIKLFKYTVSVFRNAAGRRLTSIECHDLMCMIADIVVVGGVRRSAMISLSNLSDDRMRTAKMGEWWTLNPQRMLSNNSAVYTEKPDIGLFMREWLSLYDSKSGERGIFNREASKLVAARNGRRDASYEFLTNPCCFAGDTWIQTSNGPRMIKDLLGVPSALVINGKQHQSHTGSWISGRKNLFRLTTDEGFTLDCTDDHRIMTASGWKMLKDLERGEMIVLNQHDNLSWDGKGNFAHGYILGAFVGDGNWIKGYSENATYLGQVKVWPKDVGSEGIAQMLVECMGVANIKRRSDAKLFCDHADYKVMGIGALPHQYGLTVEDKHDIRTIETCSTNFYIGFLKALFDADGHVEGNADKGYTVRLGQSHLGLMQSVQRMLLRLGIHSKIRDLHDARITMLPDGKGGSKEYECKKSYRLLISGRSMHRYANLIGFAHDDKHAKLKTATAHTFYKQKFVAKVENITFLREDDVYDIEVDSDEHAVDANGFVAHNSEIILRPYEFCNLTEVIVRSDDTPETLAHKVRLATILGTIQSTFTHFPYLRRAWKKNTEEERLLGVSMTGIYDNKLLNNWRDKKLPELLQNLRNTAIDTNKMFAERLGIPQSTAITCVKPSGTVSQLTDTASGIHPRHERYYFRRVRQDNKDPLTQYMINLGVQHEPDVMKPDHTTVFTFPKKAPKTAVMRSEITALDHLELWLQFQRHWCVSGETMILTKNGYQQIGCLVGKKVNIWNGHDWSNVIPYETGSQQLYRVEFSDGSVVRMTSTHKLVMKDGSRKQLDGCAIGDVVSNDYRFPEIEGVDNDLPDAYSQGFYSGDGYANGNWTLVYKPKYGCISRLKGKVNENETSGRGRYWKHSEAGVLPKNFVPVNASTKYKIDWLAGIIDSDGSRIGPGLQIAAVNRQFLLDIKLLLNTIGIKARVGVERPPTGYGVNIYSNLYLTGNQVSVLKEKGMICNRVELVGSPIKQERILSITDIREDVYEMTYCFTEDKNHTGIFNGVYMGQCEHKPSVTINVKEHEWMAVGAWVYEHFDEVSGISFLPYDGGTYQQAPYEEVTKEQYEDLLAKTPKEMNWNAMVEHSDLTESAQTLACTAGGCEL